MLLHFKQRQSLVVVVINYNNHIRLNVHPNHFSTILVRSLEVIVRANCGGDLIQELTYVAKYDTYEKKA
jgi:hypothetical protein